MIICHIKAEWCMPGKDIEDFLYGDFYVEEHIHQEERSFKGSREGVTSTRAGTDI